MFSLCFDFFWPFAVVKVFATSLQTKSFHLKMTSGLLGLNNRLPGTFVFSQKRTGYSKSVAGLLPNSQQADIRKRSHCNAPA